MASKLKEYIKSHEDRINDLKNFILIALGYGLLLNYTFLIFFKIPFKWYGFPAFGIAYYFVTEEFVAWFRKLKARVAG